MNSYRWCVEAVPPALRYPAGAPSPLRSNTNTSAPLPLLLQAIAMSIADAQAAAAAAASGGDGEVAGEEDDSHKRRRTEGTEGTEGDGATPMEEDASLEAAIAASMADAGGQNPFASLFTTAPPAAASPPQPQPQPPPPPQPPTQVSAHLNAASLAQAFASIGQPAAPAVSTPQHQHHQQQHHQRSRRETRSKGKGSGVPVQAVPSTPASCEWWKEGCTEEPDSSSLEFADATAALAALSGILAAPVAATGVPPPADSPPGPPLHVVFTRGTSLGDKVLDAVVKSRFTSGRLKNGTLCDELGACHSRAVSASIDQHVPPLGTRVRRKLAEYVLAQLEQDDGEDLYFEGGRKGGEFLDSLGRGECTAALLVDMLDATRDERRAGVWIEVMKRAFKALHDVPLDAVEGLGVPAKALDVLTDQPRLLSALSHALASEACDAQSLGSRSAEMGTRCVMGAGMSRGSVAMLSRTNRGGSLLESSCRAPEVFTRLKRYPRCAGDRERYVDIVRRGAKTTHDVLHGVFLKVVKLKGVHMDRVLAWMSACVGANERDKGAKATHRSGAFGDPTVPTDNFLVSIAAVALRFARPIADGATKLVETRLVDLAPLRRNWRHDWAADDTLARRPAAANENGRVGSSTPSDQPIAFVPESFYLAARAFTHALIPAVRRYEDAMHVLHQRAVGGANDGGENPNAAKNAAEVLADDADYNAFHDCASSALLDPELAGDACRFSLLTAHWLTRMARVPDEEARKECFGLIPEDCVKSLAEWVVFVLRHGKAEYLLNGSGDDALSVRTLVRCACELLSKPHLVRHPTVHAALVEMLQAMLIGEAGHRGGAGSGVLGVRGSATHELLVTSVLSSEDAKTTLCPALIRAYSVMDAVEGLDVDRDKFDKFHTRDVIARLLEELWTKDECVASVAELKDDDLFADFAGCVLGDLAYVLQDSLDRLTHIAEMEKAKADELAWNALPARTREEKEQFTRSQERTATGYLRNAKKTLQLLNLLASSTAVAPAFVSAKVAGKAAHAVVHFLEVLLGPKCANLKVKNPKKYGFDPKGLVLAIVEFTVRLDGVAGGFAEALALEDDYDAAVMERARDLLIKHTFGAAFLPPKMRDIIDAVERINDNGGGKSTTPGKLIGSVEVSDVLSPGAAPTDPQAASDALLAALGPEPDDYDWEATYKAGMETLGTFGEVDGGVPIRDFFSQFAKNSEDDDAGGVPSKAKQKKLARESAALYENQLPCEAGSSIFLRHDPDRFDRCRAVVTGPHGTPYSGGCFVFDVYFPAGYPEKPPMVNLDTTGGGRVRFNPNLYADGKVCLSLLGTWHGGGAEEKWDAKNSSLYQVLVSIQGLILVDDPMFNEPGFDGIRGTTEGDLKSREHNEEIRLYTVRHAMIAHLKKPRPGVGTVLTEHFRLRKWTVMREVLSWCVEASDPTVQKRMWDAARELSQLLAAL